MDKKVIALPLAIACAALLSACGSSPAEKQIEAQTTMIEAQAATEVEKRKTIKQYKECVMKTQGDEAKLRMCEALLKVIDNNPAAQPAN